MRSACLHARIIASLALVGAASAGAAPLELYGRLPDLEDVALSPDGSRMAFVRTTSTGDARAIIVMSLADRKPLGGLNIGENKLRTVDWADSDHLMITTSMTTLPAGFVGMRHELYGLQIYDLTTRKTTLVPQVPPARGVSTIAMNIVIGRVMIAHPAGHTVLFVPGLYVADHHTMPALYRANVDGSEQRIVREGTDDTRGWLVDDGGEIVAEQSYSERDKRWALNALHDGHLTEVATGTQAIDFPEILGFGPEADTLLVSSLEGGDPIWRLLSLKSGQIGPPMAEHGVLSAPIEDRRTHRMIGGVERGLQGRYVFFDPAWQAKWQSIVRSFADESLRLVSASEDFAKVVIQVDGSAHGYLYLLVDTDSYRAKVIGEVYEGLGKPLEVRRITYPAADGLNIPALLTLPDGKPPTKLPLIVLPHGGPAAADTGGFDWWSQALASQGYAVLQPNYRGSDLGWKFVTAGFGEWGRKMQTDLSDGVRYLAKQGIVDPARVCIVGGSYGGYAALAGVALDPGVYRCAASIAGISDLPRFLGWLSARAGGGDSVSQRYWDRYMGATNRDDPILATLSPARHIEAVNAPVLLIHGRDDTVVPFEQSDLMYQALKAANKPVQLVALKREDHWLSRSESRLQMLQTTVAFLHAHNPPD